MTKPYKLTDYWAYKDHVDRLAEERDAARKERDEARAWSAVWKRAAKKWCKGREQSAEWGRTMADERDEARRIARHYYRRAITLDDSRIEAAAAEADAVQRAQEAEAELREAREVLVITERIMNHAWRTVDAICGANHGEPLPIDSLPKDRQNLVYELVGLLAEHGEKVQAALGEVGSDH